MSIWRRSASAVLLAALVAAPTANQVVATNADATVLWSKPTVNTDQLDDFVDDQLDRTGVPGAAYAIVGRGGVEHAATFGHDGDGDPVTRATPFLWGSVSKPVTATLVALLVRDGLLGLDDTVLQHVPQFSGTSRSITVRQLLDHTSGLPEGLNLTDRYDGDRSYARLLEQISGLSTVAAPGERHSYSSLNYIVLAAVVEAVTEQSFGDALQQRLLSPAHMDSTPADPAEAERALPRGHRYVFGSARAFDSHVDPATQAAGYLAGSLDDLATFARLHLPDGPILDDQERESLHTQRVATGPESGYALGWRISTVPGTEERMVWHGGAAPGYQAAVLLLPDREKAVVMLQNAYSPFRDEVLMSTSMGIASLMAGAQPQSRDADPLYLVTLAVLSSLSLLLLAIGGRLGFRLARPVADRGGRIRRQLVPVLALVALIAVAIGLLAFPGLMGVSWGQVWVWAPDICVLLHLGLTLVAVVAVLGVAKVFVPVRRG